MVNEVVKKFSKPDLTDDKIKVRCKNCEHVVKTKFISVCGYYYIWCKYNELYKHPNGYCDFGKEKIK